MADSPGPFYKFADKFVGLNSFSRKEKADGRSDGPNNFIRGEQLAIPTEICHLARLRASNGRFAGLLATESCQNDGPDSWGDRKTVMNPTGVFHAKGL